MSSSFAMKDTFSQLVRLGLCIAVLAVLLYALDALYFAHRRLPPCLPEKIPVGHICPETLLRAQQIAGKPDQYNIVWVDARSESDYELNHLILPGNRVFPIRPGASMQQLLDEAIERLMAAQEHGECIVVFCTESCNSSDQIAAELRNTGLIQAPIYVLEGGWSALKRVGLVRE